VYPHDVRAITIAHVTHDQMSTTGVQDAATAALEQAQAQLDGCEAQGAATLENLAAQRETMGHIAQKAVAAGACADNGRRIARRLASDRTWWFLPRSWRPS